MLIDIVFRVGPPRSIERARPYWSQTDEGGWSACPSTCTLSMQLDCQRTSLRQVRKPSSGPLQPQARRLVAKFRHFLGGEQAQPISPTCRIEEKIFSGRPGYAERVET